MKGRGAVVARCASIAVVVLAACGGQVSQTGTGGSETNWLGACTKVADCPRGDCVCGVCTLACSDSASCAAGPPSSTCAVSGSSALTALCASGPLPAGACLLPCTTTCASGSTCVADHCVPDARGNYAGATIEAGTVRDAAPSDASVSSDTDAMACTGPLGTSSPAEIATWSSGDDGTGTKTPDPFALTGGRACFSGWGFTQWGAQLQLSRNGPAGAVCSYDLSSYSGIAFTISGTVTNAYARFVTAIPSGSLVEYGGTCASASVCGDNFGVDIPISAQPQRVTVPFSHLAQEGWGQTLRWDPASVLDLQWQIRCVASGSAITFSEVCVDSVQLY